MRAIFAMTFFMIGGPALAGSSCEALITRTDFVLSGMFARQPDAVAEINGFPLVASANHLAHVVCPVVETDAGELTVCRVQVLARQGERLMPTAEIGLAGCARVDGWQAGCPDFSAEGFTAGNAAKLAEALTRSGRDICAGFGADESVAPVPVPTGQPSPSGLDAASYHEVGADCAALGAVATACQASGQSGPAGVVAMTAGPRRYICGVAADGALTGCVVGQ